MANRHAAETSSWPSLGEDRSEPDNAYHTITASSCRSPRPNPSVLICDNLPCRSDDFRLWQMLSKRGRRGRARPKGVKRKRSESDAEAPVSSRTRSGPTALGPLSRTAGADPAPPGSTSLIHTPVSFSKPDYEGQHHEFLDACLPRSAPPLSISQLQELSATFPFALPGFISPSSSVAPSIADQDEDTPRISRWQAPNSWFQFPPEIRNMIYGHILQYPDSKSLYRSLRSQLSARNGADAGTPDSSNGSPSILNVAFGTPTILLLSRAITAECLPILQSRTLVISHLPPWVPGRSKPLPLTLFIGRRTLQSLRRIDLRISFGAGTSPCHLRSGWAWKGVVEDLLAVLMERNSFETFTVLMRMCEMTAGLSVDRVVWKGEKKVFHGLLWKIIHLRQHNPNAFRPSRVEMDFWQVDNHRARRLLLDEGTMTLKHDESGAERVYPDPEMWPGCIMQFC